MKDSKGEPIHQTLMARKMQRLEESADFRPFKFRIQAFTNSFFEELVRHGFHEKDLPMKKVSFPFVVECWPIFFDRPPS